MPSSHAPAVVAIAFLLAASLKKYEADVSRMADTWPDSGQLYRSVSAQMEKIRSLAAGLPSMSFHWTELLIAHTELVQALWRQQTTGADSQLIAVRERHARSVATLRMHALRYLRRKRTAHCQEPVRPGLH